MMSEIPSSDGDLSRDLAKFCPHLGRLPDTQAVRTGQLEALLRSRLKVVSVVISLGIAAFIVRHVMVGLTAQTGGLATLIAEVAAQETG